MNDGETTGQTEGLWPPEVMKNRPRLIVDIGEPGESVWMHMSRVFSEERYLAVDPLMSQEQRENIELFDGGRGLPMDVFKLLGSHSELEGSANEIWVKNFKKLFDWIRGNKKSKQHLTGFIKILDRLLSDDGEIIMWDEMSWGANDSEIDAVRHALKEVFDVTEFIPAESDNPYIKKIARLENEFLNGNYIYAFWLRRRQGRGSDG